MTGDRQTVAEGVETGDTCRCRQAILYIQTQKHTLLSHQSVQLKIVRMCVCVCMCV